MLHYMRIDVSGLRLFFKPDLQFRIRIRLVVTRRRACILDRCVESNERVRVRVINDLGDDTREILCGECQDGAISGGASEGREGAEPPQIRSKPPQIQSKTLNFLKSGA